MLYCPRPCRCPENKHIPIVSPHPTSHTHSSSKKKGGHLHRNLYCSKQTHANSEKKTGRTHSMEKNSHSLRTFQAKGRKTKIRGDISRNGRVVHIPRRLSLVLLLRLSLKVRQREKKQRRLYQTGTPLSLYLSTRSMIEHRPTDSEETDN